jgi:hypothetical protein
VLRLMKLLFRWMRLGVALNGVAVSLDETRCCAEWSFCFVG